MVHFRLVQRQTTLLMRFGQFFVSTFMTTILFSDWDKQQQQLPCRKKVFTGTLISYICCSRKVHKIVIVIAIRFLQMIQNDYVYLKIQNSLMFKFVNFINLSQVAKYNPGIFLSCRIWVFFVICKKISQLFVTQTNFIRLSVNQNICVCFYTKR